MRLRTSAVVFLFLASCARGEDPAVTIANGRLPAGYRDWRVITVAHEAGESNDLRAVLGNDVAINALRDGRPTFPDGSIIARIAWRYTANDENNRVFGKEQSWTAGVPVNGVQFMIKDATKISTGGWSFAQFNDGKPLTDPSILVGCYACHAKLPERDLVFSRYSP